MPVALLQPKHIQVAVCILSESCAVTSDAMTIEEKRNLALFFIDLIQVNMFDYNQFSVSHGSLRRPAALPGRGTICRDTNLVDDYFSQRGSRVKPRSRYVPT